MGITFYAGSDPDHAVNSGEDWNEYAEGSSGQPGQQLFRVSQSGVYNDAAGLSNNAVCAGGYAINRSTSSIRYKTNVKDLTEDEINSLYQTRPVFYKSLSPNDNPNHTFYGFIAEEIEVNCPLLAEWNQEDPENIFVDGVIYDRVSIFLIGIVKKQKNKIEELENKLIILKDKLNNIKNRIS